MADKNNIDKELDFSRDLLKRTFGINFIKPSLCIGDKHLSKFKTISSRRDLEASFSIAMIYNDKNHSIFIPDRMLQEKEEDRIYAFLHEFGHIFLCQKNPRLKKMGKGDQANRENKERCYVYLLFHEGVADYLAIESCLNSGKASLAEKAKIRRQELSFDDFITSNAFKIMAKVYKIHPARWQDVLAIYFRSNIDVLPYHRYWAGYMFVQGVGITSENLINIINFPPSTIEQLVYPEVYWREYRKVYA